MDVLERKAAVKQSGNQTHYTDVVKESQDYLIEPYTSFNQSWYTLENSKNQSHEDLSFTSFRTVARQLRRLHDRLRKLRELQAHVSRVQPVIYNQQGVEQLLDEAAYIKELQAGWDEENALPVTTETFGAAASFLKKYIDYLNENYINIHLPEINPVNNGTIDLEWHAPKAQLLVNIRQKDDGYYAYYYGDLYNDKMPTKGNVPVAEFSESLAVWMKYLV